MEIYRHDGRAAIDAFDRMRALSPFDPFAFVALVGAGKAYALIGDTETAVGLIEQGAAENPDAVWIYRLLASVAGNHGDLSKARWALEKFLSQHPGMTAQKIRDGVAPGLARDPSYWEGLRRAGLSET